MFSPRKSVCYFFPWLLFEVKFHCICLRSGFLRLCPVFSSNPNEKCLFQYMNFIFIFISLLKTVKPPEGKENYSIA